MFAEALPTAQPNSFAYPNQSGFNPLTLPVLVRSATSSLVYPVADGYHFLRPIAAPEPQPQPQTALTVANTTSIDFEASGLYSVAQHENQSVFKLLSALTVTAHRQGLIIGDTPIIVKASQTELVAETRMPKVGVKRAIKVAEERGYLTQTVQGSAFDGKSCYRLNLPFFVPVDTKHDHKGWTQNVPIPSSGYEQTKLDLTAETASVEKGGHKGWTQNVPIPPAADMGTNAQGQTYAQVRDSNRISTLNINNSTINSRNNRNKESRIGESAQAYAQEQAQTSAPVSTPLAANAQAQSSTPTRARNRNRNQTQAAAPVVQQFHFSFDFGNGNGVHIPAVTSTNSNFTVTLTTEQVQQPLIDHIGEVNEMVASVAIDSMPAAAPDTVAVLENGLTKASSYSCNSPVSAIVDVEPAQTAANVTASPVEPTVADNAAASATVAEYPKHNITSYEQLANEPWKPRLKPKAEFPTELAELVTLISKRFGNVTGIRSNVTQTANLLADSGIATPEFGTLMQRSASLTLTFAKARPQDKPGKRNLMPYFFATLRDQIAKSLDGSLSLEELMESYDADSKLFPIRRAGTNNQPEMFPDEAYGLESSATDIDAGDDTPEVELEEFSDAIAEIKPVSAAMVSAITMRDKEAGTNLDVFGSWVKGDVLFAKFYRPNGPCDTSRWASWLKAYKISRVEVV